MSADLTSAAPGMARWVGGWKEIAAWAVSEPTIAQKSERTERTALRWKNTGLSSRVSGGGKQRSPPPFLLRQGRGGGHLVGAVRGAALRAPGQHQVAIRRSWPQPVVHVARAV